MRGQGWGRAVGGALLAGLLGAPGASGQAVAHDRYRDHQALTSEIQSLVGRYANLASVRSLVRSDQGRDVWLLTLGNQAGRPLDSRPALLLVANLEANHLVGSAAALHAAEHLLTGYGNDPELTRILDQRTVYIVPRANPDGAELAFTMPAYEIPWKPVASEPALGGLNVRERGVDLNGDGLVTWMRVPDPEGGMIPHPEAPLVLRPAERARAERALYRVMVEGIDPDMAEMEIPMGTDGVNLNANFPHEYRYFQPHVGPHMVSEVESRALADFLHDRTNLAAVLVYSFHDNLLSPPPAQRQVPDGVTGNPPNVPTNLLPADRPWFEYVGEQFRELTGLQGSGADGEAGSFSQMAYYQMGLPSFTTPVWSLPPVQGGQGNAGQQGARREARWLSLLDSLGVDGFVEWTPARHPTLGEVEVGGFRPNVRVNPPADRIPELAEKHSAFVAWLAARLPEVEVVETTVEPRGDGVFLVETTLANEQYLPTQMAMAGRIRFNRPITVRLVPTEGMTVLTGDIQQQTPRIEGMGGRERFRWLVQAPAGTRTTLEVFAERAGGLLTVPVTLR